MEKIKKELTDLFEEMLPKVSSFKRKTYQGLFEEGFEKYKGVISSICELLSSKNDVERKQMTEELAGVVPEYAYEKIQCIPKAKKERTAINYNLNMAVYVIPILTYTREENCRRLAEHMVGLWTEKKVSSLTLSMSSYEEIAGGFKKGLCFITTAVCDWQEKEDDCYELTSLRAYRDSYMMRDAEGRALVEEYYDTAPSLVWILNMQPDAPAVYQSLYEDYLSPCIRYIEQKRYEDCRRLYTEMVRGLQKKYLFTLNER